MISLKLCTGVSPRTRVRPRISVMPGNKSKELNWKSAKMSQKEWENS